MRVKAWARTQIYLAYARRGNIKDYRELRENRGKLDFQVTRDGKSEMRDWLIVRRDPDARRLEGLIFLEGERDGDAILKSTTKYMQRFVKMPKEIPSCRSQLNLVIFFLYSSIIMGWARENVRISFRGIALTRIAPNALYD